MKMKNWSFLKYFMTPDLQNSSKNLKLSKIFFLLETTNKGLIYVLNTVSGSFGEF